MPIRTTPFAPWPHFAEDEVEAVASVLRSGKVNQWTGQEVKEFEQEFAAFAGCDYAIALANGTVALELALYALGIGPGDEVVVTPRSFMASASCVVMRGATPVFADVDPITQNISAETIAAVLTERTKAVIPVHLSGWPCDMDPILDLAHQHNLYVIEDCAQAHGATYKGRPVGSLGHIAAFSFCQDKIMTTGGEGGMITTNDRDLWAKAWAFKDHGKNFDTVFNRDHPPGFRWLHESFGTNWRMTEMQAAIGRLHLRKLPDWVAKRRRHAAMLTECFAQLPGLRVTIPSSHVEHAYYKYYTFVEPEALNEDWDRDRIMVEVAKEGIPCYSGSCSEIYLEKAFEKGLRPEGRLPTTRALGETSLMFLIHPTLSNKDIKQTCEAVTKVLQAAQRTAVLEAETYP